MMPPEQEREIVRSSIDFAKCQMDEIVKTYAQGGEFEFESFSPYVSDYDLARGDIRRSPLTNADAIGIAIAKKLREKFPKARLISLFDEYNTGMTATSDVLGKPHRDGKQIELDESVKQNFQTSIEALLREKGVLHDNDKEGENYLLISESSKIRDAEKLVQMLENKKMGFIERSVEKDNETIYFVNPSADNPKHKKILLRTARGRWLCEALDASSYRNPHNTEITHLVILSNEFREQQDKVWEILSVLGIQPNNYHNIFFDKMLPPDAVAEVIGEKIQAARRSMEKVVV